MLLGVTAMQGPLLHWLARSPLAQRRFWKVSERVPIKVDGTDITDAAGTQRQADPNFILIAEIFHKLSIGPAVGWIALASCYFADNFTAKVRSAANIGGVP